jgi:hypothetical protein
MSRLRFARNQLIEAPVMLQPQGLASDLGCHNVARGGVV